MKRTLICILAALGVAAVAYLSVIGCCSLFSAHHRGYVAGSSFSLTRRLGLSGDQQKQVSLLEKEFIAKKKATCESLCAQRERLAELLKQPRPDRALLSQTVEEIGREQMALEKATVDHLVAVQGHLNDSQRRKMDAWVAGEMESACEMTACGDTPGCAERDKKGKQ